MRGRKRDVTIGRAKKFAERQGYRWVPNPDTDMPFDALVYRANDMFIVSIRTSRNAPGEYDLPENFFRNDFQILTALPFPPYLPREVWVRYSWSRNFHRFRIFRDTFVAITMIDREKPVFEPRVRGAGTPSETPTPPGDEVK